MIFKLNSTDSISRQREETIHHTLTREDRINGDRLVMVILLLLTIVVATAFAYYNISHK